MSFYAGVETGAKQRRRRDVDCEVAGRVTTDGGGQLISTLKG